MRAVSRSRRRTRLRTTALPTLRLTVKPTRMAGRARSAGAGADLQDEAGHGAAPAGLDAQKIAAVRQPPEARRGQFGWAA